MRHDKVTDTFQLDYVALSEVITPHFEKMLGDLNAHTRKFNATNSSNLKAKCLDQMKAIVLYFESMDTPVHYKDASSIYSFVGEYETMNDLIPDRFPNMFESNIQ